MRANHSPALITSNCVRDLCQSVHDNATSLHSGIWSVLWHSIRLNSVFSLHFTLDYFGVIRGFSDAFFTCRCYDVIRSTSHRAETGKGCVQIAHLPLSLAIVHVICVSWFMLALLLFTVGYGGSYGTLSD